MAENIGGPSAPYNTQIPSISDDADIQTAFRLYHYGSNTGTPSSIPENSIAGHLNKLDEDKLSLEPTPIPTSANLNTYITTGFYTQTATPTGLNYPSNFPGLLTVVNEGATVFQQYQVIGAAESGSSVNTLNRTHWRFYFAGAWRPWRTFIEQSDFATIGDSRYYTKTEASGIFTTQAAAAATYLTIASADARQYVAENVVTTSYTLALSDTSKVVAVNNDADATITIPLNTSVAFPIGTLINIYSMTANRVTVAPATGVTLRPVGSSSSIYLFDQYTEISLRKRATNEWVASGNFLET